MGCIRRKEVSFVDLLVQLTLVGFSRVSGVNKVRVGLGLASGLGLV